jgi:hypothetical protein
MGSALIVAVHAKKALRLQQSPCSSDQTAKGLTGGLGIGFGEGFSGEPETVDGGGNTTIYADLKQNFAYLLTTQAVTQGAAHMQICKPFSYFSLLIACVSRGAQISRLCCWPQRGSCRLANMT